MLKSRLFLLALVCMLAAFLRAPTKACASSDPARCDTPTVDVTPYIAPKCGTSASCPHINASAVTLSDRNIGNVDNYVEYVNANTFKQHSNQNHFLYQVAGGINFMQDSVWGGFFCDAGPKAMYRVYDSGSGSWGAHQFATQMSCNAPHNYTATIHSFQYDANIEKQFDMHLTSCPVGNQDGSSASDTNELFFQGTATCNGHANLPIIGIRNTGGAGAGEVDFYCKGFGLCAFYQQLDFSDPANDPRTWTASTDVCDLKSQVSDYYLYPIKGLPTATQPGDTNKIFSDLAGQGYQSQCAAPVISVHPVEGGEIVQYQNKGLAAERQINAKEIVDYTSSQVPLLRDSNPIASLKASLEDFWGYQETSLTHPATLEETLSSSFIYSELSLKEQCQYKVNILTTISKMCSQLKDPNTCALYQPIPNGGAYTTKTILSAYTGSGLSCDQIALNQYSDAQRPMVTALLKTPLYLDKAYRLAFLVMVSELQPKGITSNFFDFLRDPGGTSTPRDEVRVVAFKIPDIGTNRPNGDLNYQDPLELTRNLILPQDKIQADDAAYDAARQALASGGIKVSNGIIDCDGTDTCKDPLVRAIVSIVNNTGQSCNATPDDLKYEPSSQISSEGSLSDKAVDYADNTNPSKYLLDSAQNPTSDDTSTNQKGIFKFLSNLTIGKSSGGHAEMRTYLVYPVGHQLTTVEDTLMSYIDSQTGQTFETNPDLKDYFKVSGVDQALTSSKGTDTFTDSTPCTSTDPTLPCTPNQKTVSVELGADQPDPGARILGGRLGFLTRIIQQTLNSITSPQLTKLRGCKTTEEFLTGNCNAVPEASTTPSNDYVDREVLATNDCASFARIGAGINVDTLPASRLGAACRPDQTSASQVGKPAVIYDPTTLDISQWHNPNDGDATTLCSDAVLKAVVCTDGPPTAGLGNRQGSAPALIAHMVDANGDFDEKGTMTACKYVVQQAQQHGVSPRLALAVWGEESGFSAYTSKSGTWDFGVTSSPTSRGSNSLSAQVTSFLNTVNNTAKYPTYLDFLLGYSGEKIKSTTPPVLFCNNRSFPDNVKSMYCSRVFGGC